MFGPKKIDHAIFTKSDSIGFHLIGSEKIGAEELAQVEEMRVNPFAARICELFSDDGSDKLTFMMYLNVMSTFSKETHADVKMVWIFALWDFDGDDILGPDDIMQGINLLTCSGVAIHPSLASLHRVPSSEGLDLIELDDLVSKVVDESDPQNEGLGYMDFRGLLLRMPDLLANFEITIR
ncbi:unnamed protein product [Sphagnum troendelagicum]|uniref:EF-hand domain-containing protein n=1 Tax=Sphagnum troendelagicum TaxID=128251 RepID=A0ABP0TKF0_9BRYO